jgi:hypothetical protein
MKELPLKKERCCGSVRLVFSADVASRPVFLLLMGRHRAAPAFLWLARPLQDLLLQLAYLSGMLHPLLCMHVRLCLCDSVCSLPLAVQ